MHANLGRRLHAVPALDRFQVNHGDTTVRVALSAGLYARLASDAARVVDVEVALAQRTPPACTSSSAMASCGCCTRVTLTAQILNSGIFDTGSMARIVKLLAERSSGQWYGTNTVSGRIVFTICDRTTTLPRRLSTFTKSPSCIPSFSARRGCISHKGCEYWSTSPPIRRVCVPERKCDTTRPVVRMMGYSSSGISAEGRHSTGMKWALPSG